jgi:putative ubiquitin-RnfH superfamily antitoxin RatB of RatAB toxin-antitoxin module
MIVEVAYALPDKQSLVSLEVEKGTTLKEAIEASGILDSFEQIDLTKDRVGIFSKFATLDTVLREKDRVEIYRPLIADPKQVRKERAAKGKAMRGNKKPKLR